MREVTSLCFFFNQLLPHLTPTTRWHDADDIEVILMTDINLFIIN